MTYYISVPRVLFSRSKLTRGKFREQRVVRWLGATIPFFVKSPRRLETSSAHAQGAKKRARTRQKRGRWRAGAGLRQLRRKTATERAGLARSPLLRPLRGSRQKSPAPKGGTPLSLAPDDPGGGPPYGGGWRRRGGGPPPTSMRGGGPRSDDLNWVTAPEGRSTQHLE